MIMRAYGRGRQGRRRRHAQRACPCRAAPRAPVGTVVVDRHRLGGFRRDKPARHARDEGLVDDPLPRHLGEPDRRLRLPDVAATAGLADGGGGNAGHRRDHRDAGRGRGAGRDLPGRGPPRGADVPGDGLERAAASGGACGAAGGDGRGAASIPGEPAAAGTAADVPPRCLARARHANHSGARPRRAYRAGGDRRGGGRRRQGGRRRAREAAQAVEPPAAAGQRGKPGLPRPRAGRRRRGGYRRARPLGVYPPPVAARRGGRGDRPG